MKECQVSGKEGKACKDNPGCYWLNYYKRDSVVKIAKKKDKITGESVGQFRLKTLTGCVEKDAVATMVQSQLSEIPNLP